MGYSARVYNPMIGLKTVIFDTEREALCVLKGLLDIIKLYKKASVSDFYDLCGVRSSFSATKWGWKDLTDAMIVGMGGYWCVWLPKEEEL